MMFQRPLCVLVLLCVTPLIQAQTREVVQDTILDLASVPVQPEFPGGQAKMYKWLQGHTVYPDSALDSGIQGKVYVQFVVQKDGRIDQVELKRGCNHWLDEEALRVVHLMPRWIPGRMEDGKAVRVRYLLPVSFRLK